MSSNEQIPFDAGFLANFADWSPEMAKELALDEGVKLVDQSWVAITFLREYFQENQGPPINRILFDRFGKLVDLDKRDARDLFYQLFPNGPTAQAARIAGLPKPARCCI
ncbi:MAG: TusE/DsrC/DsvC family sulfur relay protein [SAR324 cluster bacterium]|nr:TusE/DsrC/DsvC family sulfur relay protein [SAR324 cluster bacterium]